MLGTARVLKWMLPDPRWQALIRARIKRAEKWNYLQWLASAEGPAAAHFLRRFQLPLLTYLRLRWRRSFSRSRHVFITPSPRVKALAIRSHGRRFAIGTFVETGTFKGETIAAVASSFDQCITIELSETHWREAAHSLRHLTNVQCIRGDSGVELGRIVGALERPALFWLDAHSSGDGTVDSGVGPIFEELRTIFATELPHVVLIDDARGHQVNAIEAAIPTSHDFVVRNDIVRITPRQPQVTDI
jgi:hypothetical protein